jgi:hypothetical protein
MLYQLSPVMHIDRRLDAAPLAYGPLGQEPRPEAPVPGGGQQFAVGLAIAYLVTVRWCREAWRSVGLDAVRHSSIILPSGDPHDTSGRANEKGRARMRPRMALSVGW